MGRFARSSQRNGVSDSQGKAMPHPSFVAQSNVASSHGSAAGVSDRIDNRTPSEGRYFVLALAALIGLGIGWLAGKAITGSLHSTATTEAVAARAMPATFDGRKDPRLAPASAESDEPTDAEAASTTDDQAAGPEVNDSDESSAPMAVVTQAATDASPRISHRAGRRAAVRRAGRGNPFLRPFKALRRFRIW